MDKNIFLGHDESTYFAEKVLHLSQYFIPRGPNLFTLGLASYLDCPDNKSMHLLGHVEKPQSFDVYERYIHNAFAFNSILWSNFGDIYIRLADFFSHCLAAPVCFASSKALPGFHLYRINSNYQHQQYHVPHFDGQYQNLKWPPGLFHSSSLIQEPANLPTTLSFTLPLALPIVGGGLRHWNISLLDQKTLSKQDFVSTLKSQTPEIQNYDLGCLIYHDGHKLHQIQSWRTCDEVEYRITMQGHLIFFKGVWIMYW